MTHLSEMITDVDTSVRQLSLKCLKQLPKSGMSSYCYSLIFVHTGSETDFTCNESNLSTVAKCLQDDDDEMRRLSCLLLEQWITPGTYSDLFVLVACAHLHAENQWSEVVEGVVGLLEHGDDTIRQSALNVLECLITDGEVSSYFKNISCS